MSRPSWFPGFRLVGFMAVLAIVGAGASVAFGQNLPAVPSFQQVVIGALTSIQQSLAQLDASVNALAVTPGKVRATGAVTTGSGLVTCAVTNVSASPRRVDVEIIRHDGTVVESFFVDLVPGQTTGWGRGAGGTHTYHCRFSIDVTDPDGTREDFRGVLQLVPALLAQPILVLPAE